MGRIHQLSGIGEPSKPDFGGSEKQKGVDSPDEGIHGFRAGQEPEYSFHPHLAPSHDQVLQRYALRDEEECSTSLSSSDDCNPQPFDPSTAGNVAQQGPDSQSERPNETSESASPTQLQVLAVAIKLWFRIQRQTLPIIVALVLFMCAYFLPARVMKEQELQEVQGLLYEIVRGYIRRASYYTSMSLLLIYIFSFQFSRRAIWWVILPCITIDFLTTYMLGPDSFWVVCITNAATFLTATMSFYFIKSCPRPFEMTPAEEEFYGMTKDGTPFALAKGLIGFMVIVGLFMQIFVPFMISIPVFIQAMSRLIIFPFIFFVSKSYQSFVVFDLSEKMMWKRAIVNCILSLYINFIGRVILSNFSSNGSDMGQFIIMSIMVSVINVVATITFKRRTIYAYDTMKWLNDTVFKTTRSNSRSSTTSVIPLPNANMNHHDDVASQEEKLLYVKRHMLIRNITIYEEFGYEIMVIIIAPLLMYFTNPIYPETSFKTISKLHQCLLQIMLPILITFVGDIASLFFEIRRGNFSCDWNENRKKLSHRLATFFFSVFTIVYAQHYISL